MRREPVASSNIASMGYDASSQTFEVEFNNGGIYQYYNVELETFESLQTAASKGSYLNAYIKNAYPYSQVG